MKIPKILKANFPEVMKSAASLSTTGRLHISKNNLVYLNIDDEYIHQLFPLLKDQQINKPNYFGENSAGAHITVIYPEESKMIDKQYLNHKHSFIVKDLVTAEIGLKIYYVLLVESDSLLELRRQTGLPDKLNFKGYAIEFHITIGYKLLA